MRKIICILFTLVIPFVGFSQDLKKDLDSLFLNLPIIDSLDEVIKEKCGIKFEKGENLLPLPTRLVSSYYYTYHFEKHNLISNSNGELTILKKGQDTTDTFIWMYLNFKSIEEQKKATKYIKTKFGKYSNSTTRDKSEYFSITEFHFKEKANKKRLIIRKSTKNHKDGLFIWISYDTIK